MRRFASILGNILFVAMLCIEVNGCGRSTTPSTVSTSSEDRISVLKRRIAEQEVESAQSVADYAPTNKSRIDDLGSPVVEMLQRLPGVDQVEVGVRAEQPTHRIVHLRDWHFISRDLFAVEMNAVHNRVVSDEENDRLYKEFLLEVELFQLEQMSILRCLIKHHGLRRVFSEGFSSNEVEAYREKIVLLRAMDQDQISKVRDQLDEVRKLAADSNGEQRQKGQEIEKQLLTMLDKHQERLLEVGSAGRLLISGELEEVLPLEDAEAMKQANPISPSGEMKLDPIKIEARHDAEVKAALKEGPVALIILGGSHDLTESVRRIDGGNCEYLRVTTKQYGEIVK